MNNEKRLRIQLNSVHQRWLSLVAGLGFRYCRYAEKNSNGQRLWNSKSLFDSNLEMDSQRFYSQELNHFSEDSAILDDCSPLN